jgi:alginate O-acetyltransferase complex protein AlgJ
MDAQAKPRARRKLDTLLLAVFAAMTAAPLADSLARPHAARSAMVEFRNPTPAPPLPRSPAELARWPGQFERYFADHFGLRDRLLRGHNVAWWYALGVSPTPKLAIGPGEWVFYAGERSLDVHRGAWPMSPARVEGWLSMIEARRAWLAARGIAYLLVFVPSKEEVYPERLPDALASFGPTRLDQLLARKGARLEEEVLDLRPALIAEKRNDGPDDFAYHRLGTHWTDRGAYAGYRAVVERLARRFPALRPLPASAFARIERGRGDSWASHLYMDDLLVQRNLAWVVREPRASYGDDAIKQAFETESSCPGELPAAVIFHDSFGPQVRPWLAEHFSRASWVWSQFDLERIERERPDLVLEILVDRVLVQNAPRIGDLDPDWPRQAFESSSRVLLELGAERASLEPRGDVRIVRRADGIALTPATAADGILLPELRVPEGAGLLVRLEVSCAEPCGAGLFYTTREETEYSRARAVHGRLRAGRDVLHLELLDEGIAGRLLLRLGLPGRECVLHALEVRAADG